MPKTHKILGVDPGTNVMGYAVIEVGNGDPRIITLGVFRLQKFEDHQTKLKEIFLQLQEVIETYLPKTLSIESPFYGKNVQSMLKLGRAQGVCMAAAMTMGLEIFEYAPKKIKLSITGSGNSAKEQVSAMLCHLFKTDLSKYPLDATDALGAAYTHYNQLGPLNQVGKKYKDWSSYAKANPKRLG